MLEWSRRGAAGAAARAVVPNTDAWSTGWWRGGGKGCASMERVATDGKHLRLGRAPTGSRESRTDRSCRAKTAFVFLSSGGSSVTWSPWPGMGSTRSVSTRPPQDLLDTARALGLRVLVGLHYPDWRMHPEGSRSSNRRVRTAARDALIAALEVLAGRPEVLAISVGNEVPSDIARLYGRAAIEDALAELVAQVHEGDPDMLATYTGYPTAEFLRVDGQDLATFNVFLERAEQLAPYVRHLQRLSGDVPLVLTEVGLAAELHGDDEQARSLKMQLDLVDGSGCAGATIFSWTDEWATGEASVEGWGSG